MRRKFFLPIVAVLILTMLTACGGQKEITIDNSSIDFSQSEYKHITNGGQAGEDPLPYNVDVITGATLTVEGPGVVTSIPLSVRELENRDDGLFRGIYEDSSGRFIYEGMDLYYMLHDMTDGDNGILLTDAAYRVELKNSNRATVATLTLQDIIAAHEAGNPVLIAYGIGTKDGETSAPFVFDGSTESEHSLGYVDALKNDDGCLRLVYDAEAYGENKDYKTFSNVAYVYVCEESEPGFKHMTAGNEAYSSPEYTDYLITFRGKALGAEIDLTVAELESLVREKEDGTLEEGGLGYSDYYSLANNAYWYVNEYEGLELYKLLCYLGMEDAETMGRAGARTTIVTFNAADGRQSSEAFSVEALSYPDAFGFYNKNASDPGDGTYVPTNADLVKTGYPVLLAYGVNSYPYTVDRSGAGYLSGLANSGGPMRVVFGKTQYNHANGSNQVQLLSEVIAGEDQLYNTHRYTDNAAQAAAADDPLKLKVNSASGNVLMDEQMTVGAVEDVIYGAEVAGNEKAAAKVKDVYAVDGKTAVYEGVDLEYFLMKTVGIPGTVGTATFTNGQESVTVNLEDLFAEGYNVKSGKGGLPAILAFAKNGAPLVESSESDGYVASIKLNPVSPEDPAEYPVENSGGPLMLVLPASDSQTDNGRILPGVTSVTVDIHPDSYAHLDGASAALTGMTVRFYGEGLEKEGTFSVADLEKRQTQARTLDYSMLNAKGTLSEARYRGIPVYELFTEVGICNNAGDVTVYSADGSSVTLSLSKLKGQNFVNYVSPDKKNVCAMLAYGIGEVDGEITQGTPLDAEAGGPLQLIVPMGAEDEANVSMCLKNITAIEVSANDIDTWSHSMSDVYSEFLDYEMTLTLRNEDSEWSHAFTLEQLETLESLIVRESYDVLEIGECEGIDLWKFVKLIAGGVDGIADPVAVTVYAEDGYKNDLLSVLYLEGLEQGVLNADGERRPILIAYAFKGAPLVNDANHEGYTGLAGNTAGPLRIVAETVQGASVKYFNKLVVTLPGSGPIDVTVDESLFQSK